MRFFDIHTHQLHEKNDSIFNLEDLTQTPNFAFSYGIHPWHAGDCSFDESILLHQNCVAIGEIGLDKTHGPHFKTQETTFIDQVKFSEKHSLPCIIHCVKAWNELLAIKKSMQPTQDWVFHGFRKTTLIEKVLTENMYISIGGSILTDARLQQCIPEIPLERLFLETDTNPSITIEHIYQKIATLYKIELEELTTIITTNIKNVFKKWEIG